MTKFPVCKVLFPLGCLKFWSQLVRADKYSPHPHHHNSSRDDRTCKDDTKRRQSQRRPDVQGRHEATTKPSIDTPERDAANRHTEWTSRALGEESSRTPLAARPRHCRSGHDLAFETTELLLRDKYDKTQNRLGRTQILQLLKFCLKTYFTFEETEQVKGAPMGSLIPGLIAEAVGLAGFLTSQTEILGSASGSGYGQLKKTSRFQMTIPFDLERGGDTSAQIKRNPEEESLATTRVN
ncbi:unnamed protein product [Schistocephalus solidus]|uniref:Uncharacterized protein n=1 Tax=Schistocephalus solidus TaxID=70667 RepID=A0A183SEB4_SCHSO|nr:unnamed protein product [Schistocephalus solidus]